MKEKDVRYVPLSVRVGNKVSAVVMTIGPRRYTVHLASLVECLANVCIVEVCKISRLKKNKKSEV